MVITFAIQNKPSFGFKFNMVLCCARGNKQRQTLKHTPDVKNHIFPYLASFQLFASFPWFKKEAGGLKRGVNTGALLLENGCWRCQFGGFCSRSCTRACMFKIMYVLLSSSLGRTHLQRAIHKPLWKLEAAGIKQFFLLATIWLAVSEDWVTTSLPLRSFRLTFH